MIVQVLGDVVDLGTTIGSIADDEPTRLCRRVLRDFVEYVFLFGGHDDGVGILRWTVGSRVLCSTVQCNAVLFKGLGLSGEGEQRQQ
mmetsp:Transcript_95103/g.254130  ORF Transcript_95103/g.254130 Transcript_95103/m.254130 type:complete len:87 (-) Transcript_95103:5-265(-)